MSEIRIESIRHGACLAADEVFERLVPTSFRIVELSSEIAAMRDPFASVEDRQQLATAIARARSSLTQVEQLLFDLPLQGGSPCPR